MRVFIAGVDGYLGWPLAQYLTARGHEVGGADTFFRRQWVEEMGSWSAVPISDIKQRLIGFKRRFGKELRFWPWDLREYANVEKIFHEFQPEAVVHLGECPSAPYSMIDVHHTVFVQTNNITSTLNLVYAIRDIRPEAHLVKLGTMGEYGTPPVDIPEGFFEVEFRGRKARLPFPRLAGSWYHWSKVHGSNNIMFACKIWDLRATDLNQGVVYGTTTDEVALDEALINRFDYDEIFGTVLNRFCVQAAIGHPLTVYGQGGQTRGFLDIRDTVRCIELACLNPAARGECRVFNQFTEQFSVLELAELVRTAAANLGLSVAVNHQPDPRVESEQHYYHAKHSKLIDLGLQPHFLCDSLLDSLMNLAIRYADRIDRRTLQPKVNWRNTRNERKAEASFAATVTA